MKNLLGNIKKKAAALANDIASYNDGTKVTTGRVPGASPGSGSASTLDGVAALDPVLEHLLRNVRSRHVRQHFANTPAAEYVQHRSVTVLSATFNVGGKKPPPGLRLDEWLGPGAAAANAGGGGGGGGGGAGPRLPPHVGAGPAGVGGPPPPPPPDVVAVAFQELVPLHAGSVMGVWASDNVDAWDRCLAVHLNGEEWTSQRYGPSAPAAAGSAAAAAAAAAMLDAKWQGSPPPKPHLEGGAAAGAGAEDNTYVQVASKQLVGVYLSVWVRRSLLPAVRGVQVATVATGFGGYLGNKGAVAARLRLYDSSLVLVACHLTAGEGEGDEARRNADVADILRRAAFSSGVDGGGVTPMTAAAAANVSSTLGPGHWPAGPSPISEHDLVIWLGDLNYRLCTTAPAGAAAAAGSSSSSTAATAAAAPPAALHAGSGGQPPQQQQQPQALGLISDAEARAAIRAGRLDGLLAADQLNRERAAGRVFRGWHEGRITFNPTYKYKVGTHMYNGDDASSLSVTASASSASLQQAGGSLGTGGEEDDSATGADPEKHKRRTPAWCDRVLWWVRPGGAAALSQLSYWRGEMTMSDHRPVAAAFSAQLVSYDRPRIESLLEAALRAVDMMQQSMRPKVTVEPIVLEAGDWVTLGRPVALTLTLSNTGPVDAIWHFVPPPNAATAAWGKGGGGGKFGLDDETPPLPPWLTATPAEGVLAAGAMCEVTMTVRVEGGAGGAAAALSAPPPSPSSSSATAAAAAAADVATGCLDSIVILRIEDSGDKFVSIGGRYRRSFLGMPLEALAATARRPALPPADAEALAAQLGLGPLDLAGSPLPAAAATDGGVPREVAALLAALAADGAAALRAPGIFADSAPHVAARAGVAAAVAAGGDGGVGVVGAGEAIPEDVEAAAAAAIQPTGREAQRALLQELESLRLHLDGGSGVPSAAQPHDVAALLLLWAGQLPSPLISRAAADAAAAAAPASPADAAALLQRHCDVPTRAVLAALLAAARGALAPAQAAANGLTAARLAGAMSAWLLPPLAAGAAADAGTNRRALLLMMLDAAAAVEAVAAVEAL